MLLCVVLRKAEKRHERTNLTKEMREMSEKGNITGIKDAYDVVKEALTEVNRENKEKGIPAAVLGEPMTVKELFQMISDVHKLKEEDPEAYERMWKKSPQAPIEDAREETPDIPESAP
jgi:hypothetical protein